MHLQHLSSVRDRLAAASSRRGLLGTLAATLPMVDSTGAAAKRKGRGKKRNKRNKKKDHIRTRADAQCTANGGGAVGGGTLPTRLVQTFTALHSGELVRAEVEIEKPSPLGDYFLQLAPTDPFGIPTNEVLAAAALPSAQVPDGLSTVAFIFPLPATVVAGVPYALVMSRPEAGIRWLGRSGGDCEGRFFFSKDLTGPFEAGFADTDLVFTTFVRS